MSWIWASIAPALVIGLIGLLGWWAGIPWLVPSLGPTVALQAATPTHASARPYHVGVGHLVGMLAGLGAVYLAGATDALAVLSSGVLEGSRVAAATLAVAVSMAVQKVLGASHPPAEATTLLVALGAVKPTARDVTALLAGIVLVTVLGEALRRMRLSTQDRDEAHPPQ